MATKAPAQPKKERRQLPFQPEYHEGAYGECYYALPGRRGGSSTLVDPDMHQRCWMVCREAFVIHSLGAHTTYEEANDIAAAKAMEEFAKGQAVYTRHPGRLAGYLLEGEQWQ